MAAYAALVSLMNNIEQITNQPHFSTSLNKNQIESLGEKVDFLLDFIEKHSSYGGNEEADDLERRIASAAYEAEDAIESHIVDQIPAGSPEKSASFLPDLQRIIEEMDCIKENVIKVKVERGFKDEQPTYSIPATSWRPQTRMVGFDEKLIQLKDVLTNLTGHLSSRQIISVAGMGGIGKSTLVRNAYDSLLIVEHFDLRGWVTISQQYSVRGILIDLLSCIEENTSGTERELGDRLRKSLWNTRYLIILDDMWSIEVWDKIEFLFPDNDNGSRIVLTTRLSDVASHCSSSYIMMDFLDKDKSWIVFCETVFGLEDCPLELIRIGRKIVEVCKGLPLSIVVIGGLLRRSPKTVMYWNNVAANINSFLNSGENEADCSKILFLSYSQLDVHLKPCFLYFGVFPEDEEIRASQIIRLWVAEGFIKPNGTQIVEEIAEGYLNDMATRNLILVGKRRWNGKIRSCRIHDLMRDVCLRVCEKEKFLCAGRALGINGERRLIYHDLMSSDDIFQMFDALESAHLVRTLICKGMKLPVVFRLLRVLNRAEDSSLEAISQNLNLRFLSYKPLGNLKLVVLPCSISLIWNLQTLAILRRGTNQLVVAPLEIWNLPQLRHVECNQIYLPDPPRKVVVLENLRTLIKAVNLRLSEEVCKRIPNINKLQVIYDDDSEGYDDCLFDHLRNLGSLHKLQSLKLVSRLDNLQSSCADLLKCTFPRSLNKLTLTNWGHDWEDLTVIGSLPQLEVLKLHNCVFGQNWSPVNGEFLTLKFLSIAGCNLRCWNADSSHFPVLENLNLSELRYLEEIPLDIGEIPTLQCIRVYTCGKSAEISAKKIKEQQESLGNDGLQIIVTPTPTPRRGMVMRSILQDFIAASPWLRSKNSLTN